MGHQGGSPWAGRGWYLQSAQPACCSLPAASQAGAPGALDPGTTSQGNLGDARLGGGPLGATLKGTRQDCWPHIILFLFFKTVFIEVVSKFFFSFLLTPEKREEREK